ncbi:MAG: phosphatase PAP2 family protein [Polyangiaceae bacterium]|nr:phosphatase PAP2 family protein [Polyangiaceae bacterium]
MINVGDDQRGDDRQTEERKSQDRQSEVCKSEVCKSEVCKSEVCKSEVCKSEVRKSDDQQNPNPAPSPAGPEKQPTRLSRIAPHAWIFPISVLSLYSITLGAFGELRAEHIVITGLMTALVLIGPRCRAFVVDLTPFSLLAVGYDSVRYAQAVVVRAEGVLGCDLRDMELRLFPYPFAEGMTLPDWFAINHHPVVDLYTAVPYFGFVYFAVLYAVYLFITDRPRMRRFIWALCVANYIAFFMYVFVPAAPPWYIIANGCEIDLSAPPNSAGLARVDDLLGISYFASFYSRAASVFGAMPSMHCAFPMLGLLTAWRSITWKTKWIHVLYASSMVFAAVYLTHHWVLDAIAGWAVAITAVAIVSGFPYIIKRITVSKSAMDRKGLAT